MPTYEYACSKCGHQFEKIQPIAAKSLTVCLEEVCPQKKWGRGKVKRLISAGGGLIFKGSGFYITDYRSEKYNKAAKKNSAATTPPAGETKPARAKSEPKPAKTSAAKK